jgi:hypothetical protein
MTSSEPNDVDHDIDPVLDDSFPRISEAELSLPLPPEQDELPEGEQPEPEPLEEL